MTPVAQNTVDVPSAMPRPPAPVVATASVEAGVAAGTTGDAGAGATAQATTDASAGAVAPTGATGGLGTVGMNGRLNTNIGVPGQTMGAGGLGNSSGMGGGGVGEGTIGLGRIGTGYAGPGYGGRFARPTAPMVRAGPPAVSGGLPPEVVRRVVLRNLAQVRYCYERGLAINPHLAGRVVIRAVINPQGAVAQSAVSDNMLPIPAVSACIANAFRRWQFPAPEGGGMVTVGYPFTFEPPSSP